MSTNIEVGGAKLRKIGEHLKKNVDNVEKEKIKPSKQTKIGDSFVCVKKRDLKADSKVPQQWEKTWYMNPEIHPTWLQKTYLKTKIEMNCKYKIWMYEASFNMNYSNKSKR